MRTKLPSGERAARKASSGRGFSLLEVTVAILVLAVALVGLTQAITLSLGSCKESELQTSAALIAAGQIETLRAEGDITDGETEGEGELYHWKQTVSPTQIDGLHEVLVEVSQAQSGKLIYELRTLLFEAPEESSLGGNPQGGAEARRRRER